MFSELGHSELSGRNGHCVLAALLWWYRGEAAVEHTLAHIGRWQGRRARYTGIRKNLFDLRRVAVVHNLHAIARQLSAEDYGLAV